MTVKCTNCGSSLAQELDRFEMTSDDHNGFQAAQARGSYQEPIGAIIGLGMWGAKVIFSKAYKCRSCGCTFRKWN
ncbi:MAG: hypothetical protein AAFO95_12735 [Cyanobacteria bacterium J06600_6]